MTNHKDYYRRRLPHIQSKNGVFAITITLHGSLPKHIIQQLQDERNLLITEAKEKGKTALEIKNLIKKARALYFGRYDELLDNPASGPSWLKQDAIAQIIVDSLHFLDKRRDFKLATYCIMSNHVHLVVYKCNRQLYDILHDFKSFTGLKANNVIYGISKKGEKRPKFWQFESYDHQIRNRGEFAHSVAYILNNPVKARLVKNWRDWKFSFVREEFLKYAP
jgi:REP element-mobilizing transposase RayT